MRTSYIYKLYLYVKPFKFRGGWWWWGVWCQTLPPPPPPPPPQTMTRKIFQVQKSSWSFRVGGGGGGVWYQTPPPPHHHLKLWQEKFLKFSKSKKSSWSLGVVVGGFWCQTSPHQPPPQTLTRKFSKSKKSSCSLGGGGGGGVSEHHFSQFWHILHLRGWLTYVFTFHVTT